MTNTLERIQHYRAQTMDAFTKVRDSGITDICIVGLGYIGLPTAVLLADRGFQVHGVDVKQSVVDSVNAGHLHFVEPGLDEFLQSAVQSGHFHAFKVPQAADVFFICVPTPFKTLTSPQSPAPNPQSATPNPQSPTYQPDLSMVMDAAKKIAPLLRPGNTVILESTSPVGATEMLSEILENNGVDIEHIQIAYCPERVLPGRIVVELIENDRIVGGINAHSTRCAAEFYRSFIVGEVLETNCRTAEMCKLVENSSRDVQIAFANELSLICDKLNIDVWELIALANRHPRVNILNPGTGVGGHCIAVDPWFIVACCPDEARLIRMAREVNKYKTLWVIEKIRNLAAEFQAREGRSAVLGLLGLAFKPNIDDLRESPAVEVAEALVRDGADVLVCEPHIASHARFTLVDLEAIGTKADLLFVLVGHDLFKDRKFNAPVWEFVK